MATTKGPETNKTVIEICTVDPLAPMYFGDSGSENPNGNANTPLAEARMKAIERLGRLYNTYWIVGANGLIESDLFIGSTVDENFMYRYVMLKEDYDPHIDGQATHFVTSIGYKDIGCKYPFATMRVSKNPRMSILKGFVVVNENRHIQCKSLFKYMENLEKSRKLYVDRVLTLGRPNLHYPKKVARTLLLIAFGCSIVYEATKNYPYVPVSVGVSGYNMLKALQAVLGPHFTTRYEINTCGVRMNEDGTTGTLVSDNAWVAEASNAGIAFTLSEIFRKYGDNTLAAQYREFARRLAETDFTLNHSSTFLKSIILHDRFLGFYLWLRSFNRNLFTTIQTIPKPRGTNIHIRSKVIQALGNIIRIPVTQMIRWAAIRQLVKGLQDLEKLTGSPVTIEFNSPLTNMNGSYSDINRPQRLCKTT